MPRLPCLRSFLCTAALAGSVALPLAAQTVDDGGVWALWLGQGRFGGPDSALRDFRWWLDAQVRQRDEGEHFDLGVVRPALGYALSERVTAHVGYACIVSDPVRRDDFLEHRAWQQVLWNVPVEGFTLQSRTRLEQRFLEDESETGWRLREFVKATLPLTDDRRLFVSVWDEGFWDLCDTDWGQRTGFRQNRAFAGLGWFFDEQRSKSVEVGYLNQWLDRPAAVEDRMNHILSLNVFMVF